MCVYKQSNRCVCVWLFTYYHLRMTLRDAKCEMPTMRDMSAGFQKDLLANSIFHSAHC